MQPMKPTVVYARLTAVCGPIRVVTAVLAACAIVLSGAFASFINPVSAQSNVTPTNSESVAVGAQSSAAASSPLPAPRPEADEPDRSVRPSLKSLDPQLEKLLAGATPLNPDKTVLTDVAGRRVIIRGEVACRNCVLEMLCVPEGIKEHETILRMRSKAYVIHAGLLAIGLETGKPAQFSPEFKPPEGQVVSIYASWLDEDGRLQRKDVRTWIRRNIHRYFAAPLASPPPGLTLPYKELRFDKFNNDLLWFGPMSDEEKADLLSKWDDAEYRQAIEKFHSESQSHAMEAEFVFVGSGFYTDPDTREQYYKAEGGYVICVANFADALIDIREASSASDGAQAYEAWTEHIPPEGTAVLLEIVPVKSVTKRSGTKPVEKSNAGKSKSDDTKNKTE